MWKFDLTPIFLTLLLASAGTTAAPAPWYWWQSTSSSERVCAQVMTGQWQRVGGPFEDSRCAKRATPAR